MKRLVATTLLGVALALSVSAADAAVITIFGNGDTVLEQAGDGDGTFVGTGNFDVSSIDNAIVVCPTGRLRIRIGGGEDLAGMVAGRTVAYVPAGCQSIVMGGTGGGGTSSVARNLLAHSKAVLVVLQGGQDGGGMVAGPVSQDVLNLVSTKGSYFIVSDDGSSDPQSISANDLLGRSVLTKVDQLDVTVQQALFAEVAKRIHDKGL